jgi:hypothetical protein
MDRGSEDLALMDPRARFATPWGILNRHDLSRAQKVAILRDWEYDERSLAVAADEAMLGGERDMLRDVRVALGTLVRPKKPSRSPTKHG